MGLFDVFKKKDCEICGKEVGMFGYKKLEDGEICKDCVKLLSPWFDDRRHSTVDQIKAQLAYREENRKQLAAFRPTVDFGERYTLRAEVVNGVPTRFVVAKTDDYLEENADLISFKDVTAFSIDVDQDEEELKYTNDKDEEVSYNPPRYEYRYDFSAKIHIDHPYFTEISFELNRETLALETVASRLGMFRTGFDPNLYPEYRQYRQMCDDLEALFRAGMSGAPLNAPDAAPQPAAPEVPAGPKFCPNCGAPAEGGKFCQNCGTKF